MASDVCNERRKESNDKKKIIIISVISGAMLLIAAILIWYLAIKIPQDEAYTIYVENIEQYNESVESYNSSVEAYNAVANEIIAENDKIEKTVNEAQALIDCGDIPYDQDVLAQLNNTLKNTRNNISEDPEIYEKKNNYMVDEELGKALAKKIRLENDAVCRDKNELEVLISVVENETDNLVIPDYSSEFFKIGKESEALSDSYLVYKQIINPSQDFVYKKLGRVKNIAYIACVTEKTDPYGRLNKDGSYNAILFFSSPLLEAEGLTGDAIIDEGTDCGGCVEVFPTIESATARNDYLACFDGSILDPGKHQLLGTMVLRISAELPASKQDIFMNELVEALTSLE